MIALIVPTRRSRLRQFGMVVLERVERFIHISWSPLPCPVEYASQLPQLARELPVGQTGTISSFSTVASTNAAETADGSLSPKVSVRRDERGRHVLEVA